ncbi:MAG: hypothetical protein A4E27_00651 [Methanobacterium sp. PtaU1.Bin242]|nr:MAG: hypothetical protein A4E27_00651 [Methanobacterium sp. PtaU1.Bin242]
MSNNADVLKEIEEMWQELLDDLPKPKCFFCGREMEKTEKWGWVCWDCGVYPTPKLSCDMVMSHGN